MDTNRTIVVTGAAGFIGSCLTGFLNRKGFDRLVLVDDFSRPDKTPNLQGKNFLCQVDREQFFAWLKEDNTPIDAVFHLGARTDTTDPDLGIFEKLNLEYSKRIWEWCTEKALPLVYASSAATYGAGEQGYADDQEHIARLHPLNPYGLSKHQFDLWALSRPPSSSPPFWAGLKFFNVYGPNEFHKGRMASVIFHAFRQARESGEVRLFKSHRPDYSDGEQRRDFIYVMDVLEVCFWLMDRQPLSGIFNLGTGRARTFNDLAAAVFASMNTPAAIHYIDTPQDIRDNYQYFTEAVMDKLKLAGYPGSFTSLEEGVQTYIGDFLEWGNYF